MATDGDVLVVTTTGHFEKTGTGVVTLTPNTILYNNGTASVVFGGTGAAQVNSMDNAGRLVIKETGKVVITTLNNKATGTVAITGVHTADSTISINNAGTVTVGDGTTATNTITATITDNGTSTLNVNNATLALGGASGSDTITLTDATITGAHALTGDNVTLNNATVANNIVANKKLTLEGVEDIDGTVTTGANAVVDGDGKLTSDGTTEKGITPNANSTNITVEAGKKLILAGNTTISGTVTVGTGATLDIGSNTLTIANGGIVNNGGHIIGSNGTITLLTGSTYNGNDPECTTVSGAGTVSTNSKKVLKAAMTGSATKVIMTGSIEDTSAYEITGTKEIDLGGYTLTTNSTGYYFRVQGSGQLTFSGTGTVTSAGVNGTLFVAATASGNPKLTIGANVTVANTITTTEGNHLAGAICMSQDSDNQRPQLVLNGTLTTGVAGRGIVYSAAQGNTSALTSDDYSITGTSAATYGTGWASITGPDTDSYYAWGTPAD